MTHPNGFRIVLWTISKLLVKIKNKGKAVILVVPSRRAQPAFLGVAAAYRPSLCFDKSDTGTLFVTLAVEIFEIPTVSRCPVQKGYLRGKGKVFDLSCQKAYLFIVCQNERLSKVKSLHNT
jgi:hypothetical protein